MGFSAIEGQNKKGLLIFYEAPEVEVPELKKFLAKILHAIHLDLEEDTLFVNRKPEENYKLLDLMEKYRCRQVLLFGVPPPALGIRFTLPAYQLTSHQGVSFLWADALSTIFAERQAGGKKMSANLWKAIQEFDL